MAGIWREGGLPRPRRLARKLLPLLLVLLLRRRRGQHQWYCARGFLWRLAGVGRGRGKWRADRGPGRSPAGGRRRSVAFPGYRGR